MENTLDNLGPIDLLILQSTSFCNINCTYCYLPDRNTVKRMTLEIFEKIIQNVVASQLLSKHPLLLWHAGEPLTVPVEWYKQANAILKKIDTKDSKFVQSFQTNGVLINDEWCKFFKSEEVRLGISIDGPKFIHDKNRLTRRGLGTFSNVMKALDTLSKHDLGFRVISVLTSYSLDYPDEIYNFFCSIGAKFVGFNIEESEGVNISGTLQQTNTQYRFAKFMHRMYELQMDGRISIREFVNTREAIINVCSPGKVGTYKSASLMRPMSILTIGYDGNATTFSPELLGSKSAKYGEFSLGNVANAPVHDLLKSELFKTAFNDIKKGVELCRETCEYFSLCGGGFPSNKLSENGTFASSETQYCTSQIKPIIDVVLDNYEAEIGIS